MKIKLLLLLGIIFSSHSITAYSDCPFSGFFVGENIGLGINMAHLDSEITSIYEIPTDFYEVNSFSEGKTVNEKLWGELFTGWGCCFCNRLYLSPRFGVNFSSYSVRTSPLATFSFPGTAPVLETSTQATLTAKLQPIEYTLDGKIGWLVTCKTLAYALVGVAFNRPHFDLDVVAEGLEGRAFPDHLARIEQTLEKAGKLIHFRWGLGLEQMLTCHLSTQLQYTYTHYGSISNSDFTEIGVQPGDPAILRLTSNGRTSLSRQTISVGLSYHF